MIKFGIDGKKVQELLLSYFSDNTLLEDKIISETPEDNKVATITIPTEYQQKILYSLGKEQLIYVYNNVMIPYFSSMQNYFEIDRMKGLISLYKYFDQLTQNILNTKQKNIPEAAIKDLNSIIDIHKTTIDTIQKNINNISINPFEENDNIKDITDRINKNMNTIGILFNSVLAPIGNGYRQLLYKIDKQLGFSYFSKVNYYLKLNELYKNAQKIFLQEQFKIIVDKYNTIKNNIYGTYLKSKFIDIMEKIKPVLKDAPNIQGIPANIKHSIKNRTQEMQDIFNNYATTVKNIGEAFEEYNSELINFVSSIDISDSINGDSINRNKLSKILSNNDRGFFNQNIQKVTNIFIKKAQEYVKKAYLEKDEEEKQKEDKAKNPQTAEEYIKYYMGFSKDSEINQYEEELLEIIAVSQQGWNRQKSIIDSIGKVNKKEQIYDALKQSVEPENSFIDLLQKWFALRHKNSVILYGADQIYFDSINDLILEKPEYDNDDEMLDEKEETSRLATLYEIIEKGEYSFRGEQNGHKIIWKPNDGTKALLDNIKTDTFISLLSKKKKEFYDSLFFTNWFYKNILYTDNGNESYKDKQDIINQDDVEKAARKLNVKTSQEEGNIKLVFKDYIRNYDFDKNDVENLNATSMKVLINNFSKKDIAKGETKSKSQAELVSNIGILLVRIFNSFIEKYGEKIKVKEYSSNKDKASALSTLLITSAKQTPTEKLTREVASIIYKLYYLFESGKAETSKHKKNPGTNFEIQNYIVNILEYIKKIIQ